MTLHIGMWLLLIASVVNLVCMVIQIVIGPKSVSWGKLVYFTVFHTFMANIAILGIKEF